MERIRSFFRFPEGEAGVLDPWCGEGAALQRVAQGTDGTAYGIEPDDFRADQAKTVLDHVLRCGYEDACWNPEGR